MEVRPSLVVSPPTLTRHWTSEMNKFVGEDILRPLLYAGKNLAEREGFVSLFVCRSVSSPSTSTFVQVENEISTKSRWIHGDRRVLRCRPKWHRVLLVRITFSSKRNSFLFLSLVETIPFNYCVLDEGHVIRNPKTKLSKAIRQISAGKIWSKRGKVRFHLVSCSPSSHFVRHTDSKQRLGTLDSVWFPHAGLSRLGETIHSSISETAHRVESRSRRRTRWDESVPFRFDCLTNFLQVN